MTSVDCPKGTPERPRVLFDRQKGTVNGRWQLSQACNTPHEPALLNNGLKVLGRLSPQHLGALDDPQATEAVTLTTSCDALPPHVPMIRNNHE